MQERNARADSTGSHALSRSLQLGCILSAPRTRSRTRLPALKPPWNLRRAVVGTSHGLQRKRAARSLHILPSRYKKCAPGALSFTVWEHLPEHTVRAGHKARAYDAFDDAGDIKAAYGDAQSCWPACAPYNALDDKVRKISTGKGLCTTLRCSSQRAARPAAVPLRPFWLTALLTHQMETQEPYSMSTFTCRQQQVTRLLHWPAVANAGPR